MYIKILIISIVIFVISLPIIEANIDVKIQMSDSFTYDDFIYFNYTVDSDEHTYVNLLPYIICPTAPMKLLNEIEINLTKNTSYIGSFSDKFVDDSIEPQTCTAFVEITEPIEKKVENSFVIITNPGFQLDLLSCKKENCLESSKVFTMGEEIYLDYESSIEDIIITAMLTFPNQRKTRINLPTSIKAIQIGTYELEVTASKPGYKTITTKELFGVIEEEPEVQDLFEEKFNYWIFLIPALVIIIILVILILIKRRNPPVNQQNYYQ